MPCWVRIVDRIVSQVDVQVLCPRLPRRALVRILRQESADPGVIAICCDVCTIGPSLAVVAVMFRIPAPPQPAIAAEKLIDRFSGGRRVCHAKKESV